jgi:hypothetical protein
MHGAMEEEMARTMSMQGSTREEMMGDGKQMMKAKFKAKVYMHRASF